MKLGFLVFFITFNTFASNFNGYIIKLKEEYSGTKSLGIRAENLTCNYLVWKPINKNISSTLEELKNHPAVDYIEPNWELKNIGIISEGPDVIGDDLYAKQWALENTGKNSQGTFWQRPKKGIDINAKKAWKISTGSREIIIGVMDSGVLYTHPDLKDSVWKNEAELNGKVGVDDDGNGYVDDIHGFTPPGNKRPIPTDKNGHGTHTAGVIGMAHNAIGGRGINAKIQIMPLKVKNDKDYKYYVENQVRAIDYAINKGVKVLTTSIGGGDYSKAYEDAIIRAGEAGITFVSACGNSNDNLNRKKIYPPRYNDKAKNMIVVCHHGSGGKKHYMSNHGNKVATIMAPGSHIVSTAVSLNEGPDGLKTGIYKKMSGSSMAAPHVSGAVALLLSQEPNLSPEEVVERVIATAKKERQLKKYTMSEGRLDIYRLLNNIRTK
jgi:subtilisin family serine protease